MKNNSPIEERILFVHSSDELYGSDTVLHQIITGMTQHGAECYVALPADIDYEGQFSVRLRSEGIACQSIKMPILRRRYFKPLGFLRLLLYTFQGFFALRRIVKTERINLIHSNTSAVLGGALVAKLSGLPHVWHVHEILEEPSWLGKIIYRFILATSDRVVCISRAVADHMAKKAYLSEKIQIIWNGVDCTRFNPMIDGSDFRRSLNFPEDAILAGVVGRISHWKGHSLFVDAAAIAAADDPRLHFVIIGGPVPGDEARIDQLHDQIRQLGLEQRVRFIPFTSSIPEAMRALDFLVLPSQLPEPLGLVVLEAMASGRPVIAAAHGGPTDTVVDQETGLLFPPNDQNALAHAMIQLAADANLRRQFGEQGRNRAVQEYSVERFQRRFAELYDSLLAE